MGSDERIVEAARVSYGKGAKTLDEDKRLINRLLRDDHTSPFEQVIFTFTSNCPFSWPVNGSGTEPPASMRYRADTAS